MEAYFHFQLGPDFLNLHFLQILVSWNSCLLVNLIFKATDLQQRFQYDLFQNTIFRTLASNRILAGRQYLWRSFTIFLPKADHFWSYHAISKKQKLKRRFADNPQKKKFVHFFTVSLHTNQMELELYHQDQNVRVTSRVFCRCFCCCCCCCFSMKILCNYKLST